MLPYLMLLSFPAFASLVTRPRPVETGSKLPPGWMVFGILLTLMIGLRFEVGGDWLNYEEMLENTSDSDFWDVVFGSDPGFTLLNWIAAQLGFTQWFVNVICGGIFSAGLVMFCLRQPLPWLAAVVAIPYLVIVVAMGYTRQGVAIGFGMMALVAIQDRRVLPFLAAVAAATLFHKTAAILAAVGFLAGRARITDIAVSAATVYGLYAVFLSDDVDLLISAYFDVEMSSSGALIRTLMNVVPAVIYIALGHRFGLSNHERILWNALAFTAIALLPAFYMLPSSTVIDRLGLYALPLQMFVFSRLPYAFRTSPFFFGNLVLAVIGYSVAVMLVWLFAADHSQYWLPYQLYPFSLMLAS